MKRLAFTISAFAATCLVALTPAVAAAAPNVATAPPGVTAAGSGTDVTTPGGSCRPTRPGTEFYEGGRVASTVITATSGCTTIAVSHIRDRRVPTDHCQTFLVAFLSTDGTDPTYTEPVRACSVPARERTVLATGVTAGTRFRMLYEVDYIDPDIQQVRYTVWR